MRNRVILSTAVAAVVMFGSGCGGNADAPAASTSPVDAGSVPDDASADDGGGDDGGASDAAANPLGNLLGLLGGADAGGGLGAILGLLGGGNTTTGTGGDNLGDLLSLLGGGGTTGTGTTNGGLGGLAALFGGGADAGTGAFGGFTTCTSNEDCANGQTCQQTPFQFGFCQTGNTTTGERDASTGTGHVDAGGVSVGVDSGTSVIVDSGTSVIVDSGASSAQIDAGTASQDDGAVSDDASLEGDAP